jgi:hypothetical protein
MPKGQGDEFQSVHVSVLEDPENLVKNATLVDSPTSRADAELAGGRNHAVLAGVFVPLHPSGVTAGSEAVEEPRVWDQMMENAKPALAGFKMIAKAVAAFHTVG